MHLFLLPSDEVLPGSRFVTTRLRAGSLSVTMSFDRDAPKAWKIDFPGEEEGEVRAAIARAKYLAFHTEAGARLPAQPEKENEGSSEEAPEEVPKDKKKPTKREG